MLKTLTFSNFFSGTQTSGLQAKKSRIKTQVSSVRLFAAAVLSGLSVYLLLGYVAEVNSNSSKGYEIKKMQLKFSDLNEQQKKLNFKVAENTSMISIQEGFLSANFVPAETPVFLESTRLTQR
jgi:hypothetical protein